MTVPGSNILATALSVIAASPIQYYAWQSRTTNSIGYDTNVYAAPVTLYGSVQPVQRNLYEQYGLDLQKTYLWVYLRSSVLDINRDTSSDVLVFNANNYQILSQTNWYPIDGWTAFIAVQVPNCAIITGSTYPANGRYNTGASLTFTLTYSANVTVTGAPQLDLTIGSATQEAVYQSGSGTSILTFAYTVQSSDSAPSGIAVSPIVNLNGGTIMTNAVPANEGFAAPNLSGVTVNA